MVPRSAIGEGASAAPTTDAKRPAVTWFHGKESGQRAKLATHGKRRRLREASAKGDAAPPSLDDIYAAAGGRVCCAVCRLPVPREHASLEHVVALASGGAHDAVNAATVSHRRCNSRKGTRTGPRRKGLKRSPLRRKPRATQGPEGAF